MGFRTGADAPNDPSSEIPADFIIIATQGSGDVKALRAAIESSAEYVAMIASKRKAEVLKQRLIEDGADPDRVNSLHSPIGLDLGTIGPHKIAISVLAHLTQWRRQR